jgi:hypothetical protein
VIFVTVMVLLIAKPVLLPAINNHSVNVRQSRNAEQGAHAMPAQEGTAGNIKASFWSYNLLEKLILIKTRTIYSAKECVSAIASIQNLFLILTSISLAQVPVK